MEEEVMDVKEDVKEVVEEVVEKKEGVGVEDR